MYDPQYEISKISEYFEDIELVASLSDEDAKSLMMDPQLRLKMGMGMMYNAIAALNDTLTSVEAAENIQKDLYRFVSHFTLHANELPERAEVVNEVTQDDRARAVRATKTVLIEHLAKCLIEEADECEEEDACE